MEHDWILDTSIYYEAGKYDYIDDEKLYKCKNCGIYGNQNPVNGEINTFYLQNYTCEEWIIKNILE